MHSPAWAIAWEIWGKNRRTLQFILGAIPVSALILIGLQQFSIVAPELCIFPMLASFLFLFGIFGFTETETQGTRARFGFPSRLFALPVRTVLLVSCPIVYGIAAVIIVYFGWAKLILLLGEVDLPIRLPLLVLATGMVSMQAVVWALSGFPWLRVIIMIVGGFGFIGLSVLPFAGSNALSPRHEQILYISLFTLIGFAYLVAFVGVHQQRSGGWRGWPGLRRLMQSLADALPRRRSPFTSPAQAQLWFEWRRKGFLLTAALGGTMALSAAMLPILISIQLDAVPGLLGLLFMALTVASVAGLTLAKSDFGSSDVSLHSFLATQPGRTSDLVLTKFKAATLIIVLGWMLFVMLAIPLPDLLEWIDSWDGHEQGFLSWREFQMHDPSLVGWATNPLVVVTAIAMTWRVLIGSMSVGLTGRRRTITKSAWIGIASLTLLATFIVLFHRYPAVQEPCLVVLPWIIAVVLLWKTIVAAWSFRQAHRRGLLPAKTLSCLVMIWLGIALGLTLSGWWLGMATGWSQPFIALGVAWLFPAAELPCAFLNLAANRHR